jgi:hypothetical protein
VPDPLVIRDERCSRIGVAHHHPEIASRLCRRIDERLDERTTFPPR